MKQDFKSETFMPISSFVLENLGHFLLLRADVHASLDDLTHMCGFTRFAGDYCLFYWSVARIVDAMIPEHNG